VATSGGEVNPFLLWPFLNALEASGSAVSVHHVAATAGSTAGIQLQAQACWRVTALALHTVCMVHATSSWAAHITTIILRQQWMVERM
jgi:hypothetical protein